MTLHEFLLARIAEDSFGGTVRGHGLDVLSRTMSEAAAKRWIVDRITEGCPHPPRAGGWCIEHCDAILRDLASVYRSHPAYRDEWRT